MAKMARSAKTEVAAVQVAPDAYANAQRAVAQILTNLHAITMDAAALAKALTPIACSSLEEQWVQMHGETLCKADAARALGVSVTYLNKLIGAGYIHLTPDSRVLTRSACMWANSTTPPKKEARRARP